MVEKNDEVSSISVDSKPDNSNLISKISIVQKGLEKIEKDGHNKNQNYDYVTEAAVKANLQNKLAEQGISIIPNYEILNIWSAKTGKGTNLNFVSVMGSFEITDGIDSIHGSMPGVGMDSGDKAIYKAETGAQKNFLMQTFLMTTGDDPEQDWNNNQQSQPQNFNQQQNNYPPVEPFNIFDNFNNQMQSRQQVSYANTAKMNQIKTQMQNLADLMKTDPNAIFETVMKNFPNADYGHLEDKTADEILIYLNQQKISVEETLKQLNG
ncbi:ERF family protein [Companilactobacillus hulinensis]|uniref:ERF family protein n=1 Tax=Companilactobacillus hulinensis TaxID=2486007 RepID=UPI000F78C105|nr:ERF family protein [Companilactobacillus hulinensis]